MQLVDIKPGWFICLSDGLKARTPSKLRRHGKVCLNKVGKFRQKLRLSGLYI